MVDLVEIFLTCILITVQNLVVVRLLIDRPTVRAHIEV